MSAAGCHCFDLLEAQHAMTSLQLGICKGGGCFEPPADVGQSPGVGPGVKPPEAIEILQLKLAKNTPWWFIHTKLEFPDFRRLKL